MQQVGVRRTVQHHLDVVVAGVLGEVQPERLEELLVFSGRRVDGDQLGRELGPRCPGRTAVGRGCQSRDDGSDSGRDEQMGTA